MKVLYVARDRLSTAPPRLLLAPASKAVALRTPVGTRITVCKALEAYNLGVQGVVLEKVRGRRFARRDGS